MKESEIEKVLVTEVRALGGRAYKWTSPGNDGVPDRIVIFPDRRPVFVELKTDKGMLSALQKAQITRLTGLGQPVEVVRGISGLAGFFDGQGYPETAQRIRSRYLKDAGRKGGGRA
jgi:hypothetical protein